ncbi:MAG: hypothetical protein A2157_08745 [Deltaproteobacteria bacterium RBG_16_47_11]|nr:MAG: hypothetical protein A2157_08745 [Deltaproteobacteria bacterium RBG_16_47_11]
MNRFGLNSTLSGKWHFLILALPFFGFLMITRLAFLPIVDEHLFHLKTIEQFASSFPIFNLKDYPSASGPLPYVFWAILGKLIGFELWKLRFLTVFISYLGSVLFFRTCQEQKVSFPLLKTLLLIFFPYIFLYSFTIYTINFALFWEIFSLRYFLRYVESQSSADLTWGSMGSLALVLSRQLDVALPVGAFCFFLLGKHLKKPSAVFLSMAPILGFLLLVTYWKGMTPPRFQTALSPSLKLTHFTLLLTVIGFYFQPVGLLEGWRLKRWAAVFPLLFIPYLLIFHVPYPEEGLGIVYYGIDLIGRKIYSGLAGMLPLYLGMVGGLVFYGIGRGIWESGKLPLLSYVLLFYLLFNCLNPFVYERHYYFAWPLILLLLPREVSGNRFLLMSVLVILTGISIFYVKLLAVFPK